MMAWHVGSPDLGVGTPWLLKILWIGLLLSDLLGLDFFLGFDFAKHLQDACLTVVARRQETSLRLRTEGVLSVPKPLVRGTGFHVDLGHRRCRLVELAGRGAALLCAAV